MKRLKLFTLTTVVLLVLSNSANANVTLLSSDDFVGISFWVTSMGMLAATLFFFLTYHLKLLFKINLENFSNF